jgi:hypothetical protein
MTELVAVMTTPRHTPFPIALTADFYDETGTPRYSNFGIDTFEGHDHVVISRFSEHRSEADFVPLHCPLNEQTRGLIGADQLGPR